MGVSENLTKHSRRLVRVLIDRHQMRSLLTDHRMVITNLPADAEIISWAHDLAYDAMTLFVESKEFNMLEPGMEIPAFLAEVQLRSFNLAGEKLAQIRAILDS